MFDWAEYLVAAKEWSADSRESHGRAAISRAYYAAFNHAKKYIERTGNYHLPRDGAVHGAVHDILKRIHVGLAKDLHMLRLLRTWADYDSFAKLTLAKDVEKALGYAERIIEKLK
jgi:hypothetical protein